MNTLLLLKYFNCSTSEEDNQRIQSWLANDPDHSHRRQYQAAHFIYNGLILHSPDRLPVSGRAGHSGVWKKVLFACTNVAAAVLLVAGAFVYAKNDIYEEFSTKMQCVNVPSGKTMELILEDGTSMFMNSGTQVLYPAVFAEDCRKVKVVHGEVLFDVARDESRPFLVETFASDIKVLGTKFNVEAEPDDEYCSTTLVRGSVQVSSRYDGESVILKPNMEASFSHGEMEVISLEDAAKVMEWTKGLINIGGITFEELLSRYEKAFDVTFVVERDVLPEISYSRGKVRISDGVEHALDVLRMASDFKYVRDYESNVIYIR